MAHSKKMACLVLVVIWSLGAWGHAANLVHYYNCNEGLGTAMQDSAGTLDGVIGGPRGADWVPGVTGYGLAFDGAGYVVVDDANETSLDLINGGAVMAWVRTSSGENVEGRLWHWRRLCLGSYSTWPSLQGSHR